MAARSALFAILASVAFAIPFDDSQGLVYDVPSPVPVHDSQAVFYDVPSPVPVDDSQGFVYDVPRPVKVVLWTPGIFVDFNFVKHNLANCEVASAYGKKDNAQGKTFKDVTNDPDYDISDADVVVFNVARLEKWKVLPKQKIPGQLWVAACWESRNYADGRGAVGDCSLLDNAKAMEDMDAVASYDRNSDFPAFFTPPSEEQLRREAPNFGSNPGFQVNDGAAVATYTSSDCRSPWRNKWVRGLIKSLETVHGPQAVLAYGDCERNAAENECTGPEAVQQTKLADVWSGQANRCMARPVAFVAENSNTPWYVTEKVWNALATGAVPVYYGASNVKELLPPNSVIVATDYASSDELVEAVVKAADDPSSMQAWKDLPTDQWGLWTEARRLSRSTLVPRLCEAAAKRPELMRVAIKDVGHPEFIEKAVNMHSVIFKENMTASNGHPGQVFLGPGR